MSEPTEPSPTPVSVPFVNTGRPFRDWLAWRIANTPPGEPVFPVLRSALATLLPMLLKFLIGSLDPDPD